MQQGLLEEFMANGMVVFQRFGVLWSGARWNAPSMTLLVLAWIMQANQALGAEASCPNYSPCCRPAATSSCEERCRSGNPISCRYLAEALCGQEGDKYLDRIARACEGGSATDCGILGLAYRSGGEAVPRNFSKATALFKQACDAGYAPGCFHLGKAYDNGEGLPVDYSKTDALFKQACEGGDLRGCLSRPGGKSVVTAPVAKAEPVPAPSKTPAVQPAIPQEIVSRIKVEEEYGNFSLQSLQSMVAETLGRETIEHLANSSDAIWISSDDYPLGNGRLYCVAVVGLAEQPPKGLNPRFPASAYAGVQLVKEGGDQSHEGSRLCRSRAVELALEQMAKNPLAKQREGEERTRNIGIPLVGEKASETDLHFFSTSGSDAINNQVFDLVPIDMRRAFDYRRLQWFSNSLFFRLDERTICWGQIGVAARSPEGRNPRVPGRLFSSFRELTSDESRERNAEDACQIHVLSEGVKQAIGQPWDEGGLLKGFAQTMDPGARPLARVKKPAVAVGKSIPASVTKPFVPLASSARKPAPPCQPPAGKILRYSDKCFNGDCTRTFENGCSRHFQAPYCYDALRGEWTWKPDGC